MITVNSVKYPFEENSSLRKVLEDLNFNVELTAVSYTHLTLPTSDLV